MDSARFRDISILYIPSFSPLLSEIDFYIAMEL